jgi:hypothetical protein
MQNYLNFYQMRIEKFLTANGQTDKNKHFSLFQNLFNRFKLRTIFSDKNH